MNNGDGYDMVTTPGINYAQDQVVFSKCYVGLLGVQVTNTETNAWGGSIEYSVDGGVTYSAMICDDCTGTVKTTEYIVIDGDDNGVGDTKCLNGSIGNVCILAVSSQPPSPTISPTTSSPTLPQLETVGSDGLPPNVYPLGRCQSDCDNDDDCEVCFICLVYKSIVYRLLFPYCPLCLLNSNNTTYSLCVCLLYSIHFIFFYIGRLDMLQKGWFDTHPRLFRYRNVR